MGYLDNTGLAYLWGKIKAKLVQNDWQQNDETAADYVKNRPGGYMSNEDVERLPKTTVSFAQDNSASGVYSGGVEKNVVIAPEFGDSEFKAVWDDVVYPIIFTTVSIQGMQFPVAGNLDILSAADSSITFDPEKSTDAPFAMIHQAGFFLLYTMSTESSHSFAFYKIQPTVHQIPAKYIPGPTTTTATLLASGWTGDSAPYSYTLSLTGVTADSNQEFLPALDITAEQLTALQAANIQDGGQAEGTVTLKAFGTKPTIDLPIRVLH